MGTSERRMAIWKTLCCRRQVTALHLAAEFNVSRRTIYYDVAFLSIIYPRVEEIAQILGIGRSTAYNLVKTGCFKVVRIGSSIRISRKSFDEWLDKLDA